MNSYPVILKSDFLQNKQKVIHISPDWTMIRLLRHLSKITGKEVYSVYSEEHKISDVQDIYKYAVLEAQHSFKERGNSYRKQNSKRSDLTTDKKMQHSNISIIFAGDEQSGKTSVIIRFLRNQYKELNEIGCCRFAIYQKELTFKNSVYNMQIMDTSFELQQILLKEQNEDQQKKIDMENKQNGEKSQNQLLQNKGTMQFQEQQCYQYNYKKQSRNQKQEQVQSYSNQSKRQNEVFADYDVLVLCVSSEKITTFDFNKIKYKFSEDVLKVLIITKIDQIEKLKNNKNSIIKQTLQQLEEEATDSKWIFQCVSAKNNYNIQKLFSSIVEAFEDPFYFRKTNIMKREDQQKYDWKLWKSNQYGNMINQKNQQRMNNGFWAKLKNCCNYNFCNALKFQNSIINSLIYLLQQIFKSLLFFLLFDQHYAFSLSAQKEFYVLKLKNTFFIFKQNTQIYITFLFKIKIQQQKIDN